MRWLWIVSVTLLLASGCADGGQRGSGITSAEGAVASVPSGAGVADIEVSIEGSELRTATDEDGRFVLRGEFEGDTALRFERAADGVSARTVVNAPAGGMVTLQHIVIDAAGGATASVVEVALEGVIVAVDCGAGRVTFASTHAAPDDADTYVVLLATATLHTRDGAPLTCGDLHPEDRFDVHGAYDADGAITAADLTRR